MRSSRAGRGKVSHAHSNCIEVLSSNASFRQAVLNRSIDEAAKIAVNVLSVWTMASDSSSCCLLSGMCRRHS
jgi:hypothetical protein